MKVLFLMITFPDLRGRDANLYSELVEEFVAHGHSVSVATMLEQRHEGDTHLDEVRGIKVLHVKCGDFFGQHFLRKGITTVMLPQHFKRAIRTHFAEQRFDLVVYPTPPITFLPVVKYLKRRDQCATYLILRDIFPQNAKDLGMLRNPLLFSYFRRQEQELYRVSDSIGCMSQGNINYVLQHNHVAPEKLELLPNWCRVQPYKPPDGSFRRKYGFEGKFIALFGGNLGYAQELEFLLELAELYKDKEDVVFLVVGDGVERDRIRRLVDTRALSNVIMHPRLPREDYDAMVRECDIGLINLSRKFTIPNIPSKMLAYFAAGIPILASVDAYTDFGHLLDEASAGLWSVTGDLADYQRNFERLRSMPELRREMGANGRRALEEHYTVQHAYSTIMQHLGEAQGAG